MQNVLRNQVNELALLNAINEAMSTDKATVSYVYEDNEGNKITRELPSYAGLTTRVKSLESTINRLQTGSGYITSNGVKSEVIIKNVPETPTSITAIEQPTTFDIDSNWFFEQFMFPGAVVDIDLSGKVTQKITNVEVCRVILDSRNADAQSIWTNELSAGGMTYSELIARLNNSNVRYYEDRDTVRLPWTHNGFAGDFIITDDPVKKDGILWYHLDKITYSAISDDGFVIGDNKVLTPGTELLYNGAVFSVTHVDATNKMVSVKPIVGAAWPGANGVFSFYKDPSASKHVRIRFGVNEYNFIFIRAISHDYGIVGNEWSLPIVFHSNDLVYQDDTNVKFKNFYDANISDWGADWVAKAKERPVSAYRGVKPNAPVLSQSDFKIVQINTHRTELLQDKEFKAEYTELINQKKEIESLQTSVSAMKSHAITYQSTDDYMSVKKNLSTTIQSLNAARTKYATISDTLASKYHVFNQSISPKYHVRGFFPEPAPVYLNEEIGIPEEIIGYDIQYRYKTVTGNTITAEKYSYTNSDKSKSDAVFSDWNMVQSKFKVRVFNSQTNTYDWELNEVSDGNIININQIDLPINTNESIEFRVRSISEAGYPDNPLRSEWSNSVTIVFDSSNTMLSTTIDKYITTAQKVTETIAFQEVLKQEGLIRHVEDMYSVAGQTNDTAYMHLARNIAYEDTSNGFVTTVSLVDKVKNLEAKLESLTAKYDALISNIDTQNKITNSIAAGNQPLKIIDKTSEVELDVNSFIRIKSDNGAEYTPQELL